MVTCIKLVISNIPYQDTDYTGEKVKLFQKRPPIYWSRKSTFRPFLVVNDAKESRQALSKCVTKSDDMFLVHRQKSGPVKFGQLIIPVLPESILTNTKTKLRAQLRSNLNQSRNDQCFCYILGLYEKHKSTNEGAHLFIAMVCISTWIELGDIDLLDISKSSVNCFNYFFNEINSNPKVWLTTPCTREQQKVLMAMVATVSKFKTKFRVDMTVNSMINIINAGHDAIYSAFLHLLKLDKKSDDIQLTLKESPNILAAGRHTTEVVQLIQHEIPANLDVIINLKGISAFSYGGKSCVAKSSFATQLLQFLLDNQMRFNITFENPSKFQKLLLFIE